MFIKQMLVTPAKAREILEQNTKNRPTHPRRISQYARDMKEGKWKQSGDSLRFSTTGRLLDGQHRLMAVVKANTPIDFVCIYDLDDSVFEVIDTGKIRNSSDVLGIVGVKNRAVVGAAARHQYYYSMGTFTGADGANSLIPATNHDVLQVVKDHPGLCDSAAKLTAYTTLRGICPPSLSCFFHYRFSLINKEKCEEFFLALDGRLTLDVSSPAMKLRQRLIENRISKAKLKQAYIAALIIKSWNAFLSGEVIIRLAFKENEQFPEFE